MHRQSLIPKTTCHFQASSCNAALTWTYLPMVKEESTVKISRCAQATATNTCDDEGERTSDQEKVGPS